MKKIITAHYTVDGAPHLGLLPTIELRELGENPRDSTLVALDQMVEIGSGWYRYDAATYNPAKNYIFTIDGGDTLAAHERYKYGGNESYAEDVSDVVS